MDGLDEGTVDFRPTYNGEEEEPEVFPGLFPNLLANGAAAIAVGMATSIPPHNAAELIDAAIQLIDEPGADDAAMLEHVTGPDFPTGGVVVDSPAAIADAYATGRGGFRVRARIEKVIEKGGGWHLVVSEIPYGVQKGKLIEQIAELINEKKLPILGDVRDESDEDDPHRDRAAQPHRRCRHADGKPVPPHRSRDAGPAQPQRARREPHAAGDEPARGAGGLGRAPVRRAPVAARSTGLAKIADRLELLDGYLIAYLNLDRVIQIIRNEDEPKPIMIAEFALTDRQAEAILNMRLRSLRRLEEMEMRKEARGAGEGEGRARVAAVERRSPAHAAEAGPGQAARALRPRDRARPAPHLDRGSRRRRAKSRSRR